MYEIYFKINNIIVILYAKALMVNKLFHYFIFFMIISRPFNVKNIKVYTL